MNSNEVIITQELLDNLAKTINSISVTTEQQFLDLLKRKRVIVYILVNWSGPERISRYNVFRALSNIGNSGTPVFIIDCSDQNNKYVETWLSDQKRNGLYYGGFGETLLIDKGNLIDHIKNPGQLGQEQTKEKLIEWKKYCC